MWEPTAEIQAAAAAPSRAIGCGGGRRGKRSAALGPEGTGRERQSRSGPGAAAAAGGGGSVASELPGSGDTEREEGAVAGSAFIEQAGGAGPGQRHRSGGGTRRLPPPRRPRRGEPGM